MDPEPPNPSRGTGLWLQWADTDGVSSDAVANAANETAMDYDENRDAIQVLRAPNRSGTRSAAHGAVADFASALALLVVASAGRQAEIHFDFDPAQVIDPEARIVPRHPMAACGERYLTPPVAARRTARRTNACLPIAGVRP